MTAVPAASSPATDLVALSRGAVDAATSLVAEATRRVRALVTADGQIRPNGSRPTSMPRTVWRGSPLTARPSGSSPPMRSVSARRDVSARPRNCWSRIGLGEYLDQAFGGIPMSQGEIVRLPALGVPAREVGRFRNEAVETLIAEGNTVENRARLVDLIRNRQGAATIGDAGLDETLEAIRTEMRRFGEAEVAPNAHEWHLANAYIPLEVVSKMAELGVFGLTIPEEFGGMGLSKVSMCVVSEELSRGLYRRRFARHPVRNRGRTDPGRRHGGAETTLPAAIASGDILPTAVFTEPKRAPTSHRCGPAPSRTPMSAGLRQQDLDHPPGARRSDDHAGAHQRGRAWASRPLDAAGGKTARDGRRAVPGRAA